MSIKRLRSKTLNYFRSVWLTQNSSYDIEQLLRSSISKKPTISEKKRVETNGQTTEIRHYLPAKSAIFLHIATYLPGDKATTVPTTKDITEAADLDTIQAPAGQEFMDGDAMVRCAKNDVILCMNGMTKAATERYLSWLLTNSGCDAAASNFRFQPVADVDKAKLLAQQGVKSITMNASLYKSVTNGLEEVSVTRTLSGKFYHLLKELFEEDPTLRDIKDAENLKAQLKISFDGRHKGGILTGQELISAARELFADDSEYVIETMSGNRVSSKSIYLKKSVDVQPFGKTIVFNDAWNEMEAFFLDLQATEALEF